MNALAVTVLLLAAGAAGFALYAGMAFYEWAKKPRHEHKWAIAEKTKVYEDDEAKRPFKTIYTLQCEGCGDITTRKVK